MSNRSPLFSACLLVALLLAVPLDGAARPGPEVRVRPDRHLTPGATRSTREDEVCSTRRTSQFRGIGGISKATVLARYGLPRSVSYFYEDDHLIPLELGGSDSIENRWPQPWRGSWSAKVKDRLENRLRFLVCEARGSRHLALSEAQAAIATDWIAAYRRYMTGARPARRD